MAVSAVVLNSRIKILDSNVSVPHVWIVRGIQVVKLQHIRMGIGGPNHQARIPPRLLCRAILASICISALPEGRRRSRIPHQRTALFLSLIQDLALQGDRKMALRERFGTYSDLSKIEAHVSINQD